MKHISLAKSAIASALALALFAPLAQAKFTVSEHERPVYQVQDESDVNSPELVTVKQTFVLSADDYFDSLNSSVLNEIGNADVTAIAKLLNDSVLVNMANAKAKFNLSEPAQLDVVVNTITPKLSALNKSRATIIYQSLLPKLHPDLTNLFLTMDNGLGKRINKSDVPVTTWDNTLKRSRSNSNMYDAQFINTNPKECANGKCYTRSSLENKVLITVAYTGMAGFVHTLNELMTDKETHYDIGVITSAEWCDKRLYSRKQCESTND